MRGLIKVCNLGPESGIRNGFSAFKQTSQLALLHRGVVVTAQLTPWQGSLGSGGLIKCPEGRGGKEGQCCWASWQPVPPVWKGLINTYDKGSCRFR